MHRSVKWFVEHRIRVLQYLEEKSPACIPEPTWYDEMHSVVLNRSQRLTLRNRWIVLQALHRVTKAIVTVVQRLQGMSTMLDQQRQQIQGLVNMLREMCPVEGPFSETELRALNINIYVVSGSHAASMEDARKFIDDLGSNVLEALETMNGQEIELIEMSVAQLFAGIVDGLLLIVAERDADNGASNSQLPPVSPKELVKLRGSAFAAIVIGMKARLRRNDFSQADIDAIEMQFTEMRDLYSQDEFIKQQVDSCPPMALFREAWKPFGGRFDLLEMFCGALATVFPNTARVEADFSDIKREKDPCRMSLSDFSLEGILQARQFMNLQKLSWTIGSP